MARLTFYGNVQMVRDFCPFCHEWALVRDGERLCCGRRMDGLPTRIHRMSSPWHGRKLPPKEDRERILDAQDGRCFYCMRRFGMRVYRGGRTTTLKTVWDHQIPWIYSQNNDADNFVAACQVCNGIKRDFCFNGPDEARVYIANKWNTKGYSEIPPVIRLPNGVEISMNDTREMNDFDRTVEEIAERMEG